MRSGSAPRRAGRAATGTGRRRAPSPPATPRRPAASRGQGSRATLEEPRSDRGYGAEAGERLTLPIEALIDLRGASEVRCEPEPQRWKVYRDGALVGTLLRISSPVRLTVAEGRFDTSSRRVEAPEPRAPPRLEPHGR